jgi:hypothetical protein
MVGDVDNDGDLDVLITNNGQAPELLRNAGGSANKAIIVKTVGKQSNRDGIGARLRLVSGSAVQVREVKAGSSYLSQSDTRAHFGIGAAASVDRLEIRWPSGRMDVVSRPPVDSMLTVVEGEGLTKRVALRP